MTFRIDRFVSEENAIVLRVCGRMEIECLNTINELIEAGKLRPHIGRVFKLEQLADAHRYQESGRSIGKNVIQIL